MPTIKINKKVFEKLVGKKLPLEKLKDRISYLGTDLEDVNENEIVVEIFPNRPDMLHTPMSLPPPMAICNQLHVCYVICVS